ncbi:uncharacterized protein LOC116204300 [Punica granatum]|uniref:Uncharacterized protein LOC116204300 n=1 Tax=Punica granatum TaxID=22663 RepID=A0A6P8DKR1_PUNGR|nr:uncharacterized protein LOC116204300 [Punica granatum]
MASASGSGSASASNTGVVAKSRKNATGVRDDPAWAHGYEVPGERLKIKCKYCNKIVSGGPYRLKHHLGCTKINVSPCIAVPDDVKNNMLAICMHLEDISMKKKQASSCGLENDDVVDIDNDDENVGVGTKRKGKETTEISTLFKKKSLSIQSKQGQPTINQMMKKDLREDVCMQIARFFYTSAIPFNCVKNLEFEKMCQLIGKYGIGLKPPSYHELRDKYLRKEVDNTMSLLEEHKAMWRKSGCSIMSDGWTDKKRRSICNFLVNSPKGTIFLTSIDTSDISKTRDKVFEMIDDIVEQVGEENVVQIVTDNAANYKAAGEMLMEKRKKLFWTPCAAHCIDLMLEDLEKKIKVHELTIMKGRKITTFIYSRTLIITMLKHFTKGTDLIRPTVTRFATAYLTLGCLFDNRNALRTMFASKQWKGSRFAKLEGGKYAERAVMDNRFWSNVNTCLKAAYPLIKVLRMVDSDEKPAMGFIYNEMEKAKQKIKANFKDDRKSYDPVWKVIDERWEVQLHRPLHAAAYYLNPQLHFSSEFRADREVMHGLYKVMDRMLDDEERDKVDLQLEEFKHERGLFGFSSAKSMRFKKTPADWWESYGADTPKLQRFSIRILSLTCSSSGCERNWSAFEMVHTKRRNRLHQKKMNDLVFVMYNLKLKDKKIRKQVDLQVDDISSDDEWIVEEETENTAALSHNFNLRSLGRGNDGDKESEDNQIGDADAENMRTQEHGTVDDLELPEENEFDNLYDDDVGDYDDLDEI